MIKKRFQRNIYEILSPVASGREKFLSVSPLDMNAVLPPEQKLEIETLLFFSLTLCMRLIFPPTHVEPWRNFRKITKI